MISAIAPSRFHASRAGFAGAILHGEASEGPSRPSPMTYQRKGFFDGGTP